MSGLKYILIFFLMIDEYFLFAQTKKPDSSIKTIEDIGFSVSDSLSNEPIVVSKNEDISSTKNSEALNNLIFCGGVENNKPVGVSSIFFSKKGQNYVYVFVEKDTAFGERQLIADLYKKNEKGERILLTTTNFSIKPRWSYTMFKHYINEPGIYLIEVFDAGRRKIGDGQVEILP